MATSQFLLDPWPALASVADVGPDRQAGRQQRTCNVASNLARDSCDGIHVEFPSLRVMGDLSHSKLSGFIVSASGTELS